MPGVAAAALYAARGPVDAASVFLATPVHYLAEMSDVRLPADGILSLSRFEAVGLAEDFNRVWSGAGIRLLTGRGAELFCVFDEPVEATTADPEEVLDRHIAEHLPRGAAAPRLRRLMSEMEMWLFEHAVNRTRVAAAVPLTGLWLWGGGAVLMALPAVNGWTAGDDPLFSAFAAPDPAPAPSPALAPAPALAPGAAPPPLWPPAVAASGVVVTAAEPGSEGWQAWETRWLLPSLAALRAGRIERLELSAGERCFSVSARWTWRPWRRRRPWWESFGC
jgi:hypothetical protein